MSSFTTPLFVEHLDGKNWKVIESFIYHVGEKGSDNIIIIPSGFVTDFASIPRFAWSIIGHPAGKYGKAAVVHDYLYRNKIGSRKQADDVFLEAMDVLGVSKVKRYTMYYSVRAFGRGSW